MRNHSKEMRSDYSFFDGKISSEYSLRDMKILPKYISSFLSLFSVQTNHGKSYLFCPIPKPFLTEENKENQEYLPNLQAKQPRITRIHTN